MTMYSLHVNINHFSRKIDTFSQVKIQREGALFYMSVNLFLSDLLRQLDSPLCSYGMCYNMLS